MKAVNVEFFGGEGTWSHARVFIQTEEDTVVLDLTANGDGYTMYGDDAEGEFATRAEALIAAYDHALKLDGIHIERERLC